MRMLYLDAFSVLETHNIANCTIDHSIDFIDYWEKKEKPEPNLMFLIVNLPFIFITVLWIIESP